MTQRQPAPSPALIAQQVIDLRRALDLLLSRPDVDAKRIAYVGHSWDAGIGAILDAVDKRIAAFVFMGGPQSTRQYLLFSDSPRMISARKRMDLTKVEQTMQTNAWADPGSYAAHLGPAPALFQYGLRDEEWVPLKDAKDYFAMSSGPKEVKFYESGHALNAQARFDRFEVVVSGILCKRLRCFRFCFGDPTSKVRKAHPAGAARRALILPERSGGCKGARKRGAANPCHPSTVVALASAFLDGRVRRDERAPSCW